MQAFFLSILKKTQTEKTQLLFKNSAIFPKNSQIFSETQCTGTFYYMNEMKKTQFFKKKLENFLKNSMHRNSSGSVKKPSGAQKKSLYSVPH